MELEMQREFWRQGYVILVSEIDEGFLWVPLPKENFLRAVKDAHTEVAYRVEVTLQYLVEILVELKDRHHVLLPEEQKKLAFTTSMIMCWYSVHKDDPEPPRVNPRFKSIAFAYDRETRDKPWEDRGLYDEKILLKYFPQYLDYK